MSPIKAMFIFVTCLIVLVFVLTGVMVVGTKDLREACYATGDPMSIECMEYREVID